MEERERAAVVVAGPTGAGKSQLALSLAHGFGGEIVNCDSVQMYRGFDIGTAKLALEERQGIPHHLIDALEPQQVFTAGDFAWRARTILREIADRQRLPVLAGGAGFYLRALFDGLAAAPKRDDELRRRLDRAESRHPGCLHRLMSRLDAETASRIHRRDRNKLIRALEITLLAKRPASGVFAAGRERLEGFAPLRLWLDPPLTELRTRLAERTRRMFDLGLAEEVAGLLRSGVPETAKPFESIGYKETLDLLSGRIDREKAIELTYYATCQYAKRQRTWFRREQGYHVLPGFGHDPEIAGQAAEMVRAHLVRLGSAG